MPTMHDSNEGQAPEEHMRAEFEARFTGLDLEKTSAGNYVDEVAHERWVSWQACAAQSADFRKWAEETIKANGELIDAQAEKIARLEEANGKWLSKYDALRLKHDLMMPIAKGLERELSAAQADNARLRKYLTDILNEPQESLSNAKAVECIVKLAKKALAKPLDTSALDAYVAKRPKMISVDTALPEFLEGKDYSANVIARLDSGILVIANRCYVDEAGGWLWAVAYGSGCDLEELEPEADDDYKIIEWMPLPGPRVI